MAKKLDRRLSDLGATAVIERGLGDDQHPSGYDTIQLVKEQILQPIREKKTIYSFGMGDCGLFFLIVQIS